MQSHHELVGTQVWRTSFDHQVRLTLVAHPRLSAELVVEVPFKLCSGTGEAHEIKPGEPGTLTPVLGLFMKSVQSVEVSEDEAITLVFDDGWSLEAHPEGDFESWSIVEL